MLSVGTRLGPYEILSQIGAGGMGVVYKARDTRLGRDVAIKVLPPAFAEDGERLRRFEREARATGSLNHPNIMAVFDIGNLEGSPYLVMELLEGETLRERLGGKALPVRRAVEICLQIAQGLSMAHEKGIIHRDLKPENIWITRDGRVKILDFGLAKPMKDKAPVDPAGSRALDPRASVESEAGSVIGTVGYMSPEQVRADPLDGRSDIFALGVMLWEMLTGKRPFQRESAIESMHAVLRAEPELDPALRISPFLERILLTCLAKDPSGRFHSAHDLAFALQAATSGSSTSAEAVLPAPRLLRRLLPWIAGGALLLAFALGFGLAPRGADPQALRITPFAMEAGAPSAPAWSRDGKNVAYLRVVEGVSQVFVRSLETENAQQTTRGTLNASAPFWSADGNRLYFLGDGDLWSVAKVGGDPERIQQAVMAADLSPDGGTLAFWRPEGQSGALWVASPPGGQARPYRDLPFPGDQVLDPVRLRFAPDGRRLYLGCWTQGGSASAWLLPFPDGAGRRARRILRDQILGAPPALSWLPDGHRAVLALDHPPDIRPRLCLAHLDKGTLRPLLASPLDLGEPAVSPDGARLLATGGGTGSDLLDLPLDGSAPRTLLHTSRNEWGAAWLPGIAQFAFLTDRAGALEIRLRSPAETWERVVTGPDDFPDGPTAFMTSLAPSPDGSQVAFVRRAASGPMIGPFIWIAPLSGGVPSRLTQAGGREYEWSPAWSPDGKWIAYGVDLGGRRTLRKVRVGGSDPPVDLEGSVDPREPSTLEWSPDGQWLLTATGRDLLLVSQDGRTRRVLEGLAGQARTFSRDGRRILALLPAGGRQRIVSIDPGTRALTVLSTFTLAPEALLRDPFAGARLSLSPDGAVLSTTVLHRQTDIWMLRDFAGSRR